MTPDKVSREDMDEQLSCAVWERAMDPATADAIRDALADLAAMRKKNKRLTQDLKYAQQATDNYIHHLHKAEARLAAMQEENERLEKKREAWEEIAHTEEHRRRKAEAELAALAAKEGK